MKSWQSAALVLSVRSHSESDKIISLYSQDFGKLTAIAKGAQKSKKRFVNKLEPCTLLVVTCRPPKRGSLFFLEQAELMDAHLGLRADYRLYVASILVCELIRLFGSEQDPDRKIFQLARLSLDQLSRQQCRTDILVTFFLLHLLHVCGYAPKLDGCAQCARNIDQAGNFFLSPSAGGLICQQCASTPGNSPLILSRQTLKFLVTGRQMELSRLSSLRMSAQNTRQAITALAHYCRHILQQDIHSLKAMLQTLSR
jgi:DNA repair protein RecO (recombination protein O)